MVRYRRNFVAGGTFFLTATLADRRPRVLIEQISALRLAFSRTRKEHPFSIDAIVVLPDHLHIMMSLPQDDANFSSRMSLIKRRFTAAVLQLGLTVNRRSNGELALWQRRFWEHTIRDEKDFERHVDYIHFNPIKHALVTRICDWPYSSFHRYVRLGLLPADWGGDVRQNRESFGEPVG
jgi:putative transposase